MTSVPVEIANFFTAMQARRAGAEELRALFSPDAVYVEPFSGQVQRHQGREAVMRAMAAGWDFPMPDMRIVIDHAAVAGDEIRVRWTCYSPGLPGGKGSGLNRYRMQGGLIAELETTFV